MVSLVTHGVHRIRSHDGDPRVSDLVEVRGAAPQEEDRATLAGSAASSLHPLIAGCITGLMPSISIT